MYQVTVSNLDRGRSQSLTLHGVEHLIRGLAEMHTWEHDFLIAPVSVEINDEGGVSAKYSVEISRFDGCEAEEKDLQGVRVADLVFDFRWVAN